MTRSSALARVFALASSRRTRPEPFRVVVADPPWPFRDALPGPGRGAVKNYGLLSISDLEAMRFEGGDLIRDAVADDAYLFLWRVSARELVEAAYRVCRAWEFSPVTELVWSKQTRHGKQHFGMGHHLRMSHETCIVATRGRLRPAARNLRSVLSAEASRIHSVKPEEFFTERVEKISHGPYLELFARRQRQGWTCVGNELP